MINIDFGPDSKYTCGYELHFHLFKHIYDFEHTQDHEQWKYMTENTLPGEESVLHWKDFLFFK